MRLLPALLPLLLCSCVTAQTVSPEPAAPLTTQGYAGRLFTRADTLRGALRPERTSFDVTFYGIHLDVDPREETIGGYVDVDYVVTQPTRRLQLDLYRNLTIDGITQDGRTLDYRREGNAVFIDLAGAQEPGQRKRLTVRYGGRPTVAKNAPWDGGFVWGRDQRERYWVGVACEGDGASLWWPNKDYLGDEPDSVLISVTVPERLTVASNGNLREVTELEDEQRTRYDWFVSYPINNYNVSLGIGHYVHFDSTYVSFDGDTLALDYYVIDYNLERARRQFREVHPMLAAYEHYLGKYPFWEDGFALIETPYLGMEHQSGIAYGNRYMRGYLGGLIPEDMDWDYIIVHEAGHEYFGNAISVADHAEMWVHESFTTYLEALYVEYHYGAAAARRYLLTQRPFIRNDQPMLGPLDVNFTAFGSSDHYYKGAWMLHTLRHSLDDDPLFFGMLRSFYQDHRNRIVSTETVVDYFSRYAERDLRPFFAQYLTYARLPELELRRRGARLEYRWRAEAGGFNMPVGVRVGEEYVRLQPVVGRWQELGTDQLDPEAVTVDEERFLVTIRR